MSRPGFISIASLVACIWLLATGDRLGPRREVGVGRYEAAARSRVSSSLGGAAFEYEVVSFFFDGAPGEMTAARCVCFRSPAGLRVESWDNDDEDPGADVDVVRLRDRRCFHAWMDKDGRMSHATVVIADTSPEALESYERMTQWPMWNVSRSEAKSVREERLDFQGFAVECRVVRNAAKSVMALRGGPEDLRFEDFPVAVYTWWPKDSTLSFPLQQAAYRGDRLRYLHAVVALKRVPELAPSTFEVSDAKPMEQSALRILSEIIRGKRKPK